jgi:2-keto-4-pentenoate hydratase
VADQTVTLSPKCRPIISIGRHFSFARLPISAIIQTRNSTLQLKEPKILQTTEITEAAALLWRNWQEAGRIEALPERLRPSDRSEAYAIQNALARHAAQPRVGWKIAATSLAGQQHIGVDGPLAGQLFANRVFADGAAVSLDGNLMLVAEAEFVFRFGSPLPPRTNEYSVEEVLAAVSTLHPGIEIPDSRYTDFAKVGAPQLIADDACASWFVLGDATNAPWSTMDLVAHSVAGYNNEQLVAEGCGANVLGDPRVALTWLVNELRLQGMGVQAGEFVTTGTCLKPLPISKGDRLEMDFGEFGTVTASCV